MEGGSLFGSRRFENDQPNKGDRVSNDLYWCDDRAEYEYGADDQEDVLKDTCQCQDKSTTSTNQEHGSDVKKECDGSVREEDEKAWAADMVHQGVEGLEAFCERNDEDVDEGADRSIIMQGDERVHLYTLEQDLDHNEAGCFKCNGHRLNDESERVEA